MKLGIVANEFFDAPAGRAGGFGWAARQVAECLNGGSNFGVEAVYVTNWPRIIDNAGDAIHGVRLLKKREGSRRDLWNLWRERIDLLLAIDYRPNYRAVFTALPFTPIIVWVRDPRTPQDVVKVNTLRIPGAEDRPQGIDPVDCTSLGKVASQSRWLRRRLLFATPAPHLAANVPATYGVNAQDVEFLPNIIDFDPGTVVKSEKPRAVFLGRLDPIKRPWLVVELARRHPEVEFLVLGQAHFSGKGAWKPEDVPDNLRLLGHTEGRDKVRILASSWVLINTSIHEALAVSFLEALKCETPLLSCQDPGGLVSRFGIYVGRWDGAGMEALDKFSEGLTRLLADRSLRVRLGKEGRDWVTRTHNRAAFLSSFRELCRRAGAWR
ncbi:MAG TPA: glycosyltransferase family 4 protein [Candidatus Acidoferrales bacterium]|nr:glycosyltransferase family 4 protein [Candidatus Acidoferrales bacterium]